MIVDELRVANLRIVAEAEFEFVRGMNLIVGSNGVGKSTVLDALAACLSEIVKRANRLRSTTKRFGAQDIRVGAQALEIECGFRIDDERFSYFLHEPLTSSVPQRGREGMPREQVYDTPRRSEILGAAPWRLRDRSRRTGPLALLFSTHRAVPTRRSPRRGTAAGGIAGACADAFANRELRLTEIAAWIKAQELMYSERESAGTVFEACQQAVARFLPNYANLRVGKEDEPLLLIDRETRTVPVEQLSDGERGILALVLDLIRRLAQANPHLADPAAEAEAVVLIDELELHLHPKWQRQIVQNLTTAFPRCQFIATTHSPQVIGEVSHSHIQVMSDDMVYSPLYSYGVDSNRILEELMGANPRTRKIRELLRTISDEFDVDRTQRVKPLLEQLTGLLGENDPEVIRLTTLLNFLEQ